VLKHCLEVGLAHFSELSRVPVRKPFPYSDAMTCNVSLRLAAYGGRNVTDKSNFCHFFLRGP
jgi:hypothetical protein